MVNIDEKVVKLQIWDTAGQDRFRAITKNYYKGSHAIFLMYDVTNINSFNSIKGYITQIKENVQETFLEMARKLISKGVGVDKRRVTLYSKAGNEKKKSCCG